MFCKENALWFILLLVSDGRLAVKEASLHSPEEAAFQAIPQSRLLLLSDVHDGHHARHHMSSEQPIRPRF